MRDTVKHLNARFVHKADDGDNWVFMKDADKMQGDCEDYSLYIAKRLSGDSVLRMFWNMLIRKCKFHYVGVNMWGHVVLEWDGNYIDNTVKKWSTKEQMKHCKFAKRVILPLVAWRLLKGKLSLLAFINYSRLFINV